MLQFEIQLGNIWDPLAKIRGYLSNLYEGCPKIRAVEILNNIIIMVIEQGHEKTEVILYESAFVLCVQ